MSSVFSQVISSLNILHAFRVETVHRVVRTLAVLKYSLKHKHLIFSLLLKLVSCHAIIYLPPFQYIRNVIQHMLFSIFQI